jgi:hypothetical protein
MTKAEIIEQLTAQGIAHDPKATKAELQNLLPSAAAPDGFQTLEGGKVIGPGTNPGEVKFEGDTAGPFYVHAQNGQPNEALLNHAKPENGWYVRFGGTKAQCETFCTR